MRHGVRLLLTALTGVLLVAGCKARLDDGQRAELAALEKRLGASAEASRGPWEAAIGAIANGSIPVPETGAPCPVEANPSTDWGRGLGAWVVTDRQARGPMAHSGVVLGRRATLTQVRAPSWIDSTREVLRDLARPERTFEQPLEQVMQEARDSATPTKHPWELIVAMDALDDPKLLDERSFESGEALGAAYLYDLAQRRVVCAGRVVAESSMEVQKLLLEANLYMNLVRNSARALKALPSAPSPSVSK